LTQSAASNLVRLASMAGKGSKQRRQERRADIQWAQGSEGNSSIPMGSESVCSDREICLRHPFMSELPVIVRNTFLHIDDPNKLAQRRLSAPCLISSWSKALEV